MALPYSREEFAKFCLRQLGMGAINIEVTDEQIDDAIDIALQWYTDYNAEAVEKVYYKHQITSTDITNKWIPMPENIIGVVNIFPMGDAMNINNMFSIRYQIALNDLYTLTNVSLVPYYMTMQQLRTIEEILVGRPMFRYSRHLDRCYIDIDWSTMATGNYLVLEAYQVIDPELFPEIYTDRWLIKYCTALIKKQWGNNTKKQQIMMPTGELWSGQTIYNEAIAEIAEMDENAAKNYSLPPMDMIG